MSKATFCNRGSDSPKISTTVTKALATTFASRSSSKSFSTVANIPDSVNAFKMSSFSAPFLPEEEEAQHNRYTFKHPRHAAFLAYGCASLNPSFTHSIEYSTKLLLLKLVIDRIASPRIVGSSCFVSFCSVLIVIIASSSLSFDVSE